MRYPAGFLKPFKVCGGYPIGKCSGRLRLACLPGFHVGTTRGKFEIGCAKARPRKRTETHVGVEVGFAFTGGGLLVHSCDEWPCAVCRPSQIAESRAYCICLSCAYAIVAAASAGQQGARALLDDISDALGQLEAEHIDTRMYAN
jgi:hypothetical protein